MRRWFERLTIRAKLTFGMGALIVLLFSSSIVFFVSAYRSEGLVDDLAREGRQNAAAQQVEAEFFNARMMIWRALANGQQMYWDDGAKKLIATAGELHRLVDATHDDQRKAKGAELTSALDAFAGAVKDLSGYGSFARASSDAGGAAALANVSRMGDQIVRGLGDFARPYGQAADDAQDLVKTATSFAMTVSSGIASGGAGLALLVAFLIIRGIRRPIAGVTAVAGALAQGDLAVVVPHADERNEMGDLARAVEVFKTNAIERRRLEAEAQRTRAAADSERERAAAEKARAAALQSAAMQALGVGLVRLAEGDLTARLDAGFPVEFAKIKDDFNHAADKLTQAMRGVVDGAIAIRSSTDEISSASDDLSKRTELQAAGLEETAAALGEITATVKKTAEGASHARTVVAEAHGDAEKSGEIVRQAVDAMGRIEKSSQGIGQIIAVIDEIAFQTNLLALNAGVEAARAGEAGRGFAVVASEVRALAQRSAEAAKEIKVLIAASSSEVGAGVKLVAKTGESLARIVAKVVEVNSIVGEIAASAQEQATGLQQVNIAVGQMDQTTQQNAAMAEEATAASRSLSQETGQLSGLVGQFQISPADEEKLSGGETRRVAPRAVKRTLEAVA
jgi:methyl-accepting chemotaxis protein